MHGIGKYTSQRRVQQYLWYYEATSQCKDEFSVVVVNHTVPFNGKQQVNIKVGWDVG